MTNKLGKLFKRLLIACCVVTTLSSLTNAGEGLRLEKKEGELVITQDGKLETIYHFGAEVPKPYVHPVNIPGTATSFVRDIMPPQEDGSYPKSYDHKHHRGIWLAVEKVAEDLDHWMEKDPIVNQDIAIEKSNGESVSFIATNHWMNADGKPVLIEKSQWTIHQSGLWVVDLTLTPVEDKVLIGDTKEGFLGVRMDDDLRGQSGGLIVNAEGLKGEKETWGKTSNWIDYTGERDGKRMGVALFDDPANFRQAAYHVRNYGLFAISPFGPNAYSVGKVPEQPVVATKKTPIKLRYGIYIHNGTAEDAKVAEVFENFTTK